MYVKYFVKFLKKKIYLDEIKTKNKKQKQTNKQTKNKQTKAKNKNKTKKSKCTIFLALRICNGVAATVHYDPGNGKLTLAQNIIFPFMNKRHTCYPENLHICN